MSDERGDELQLPLWRARTLSVLAELHATRGDQEAAETARREAQALFRELNTYETEETAPQLGR